jgi:hypothetical protein
MYDPKPMNREFPLVRSARDRNDEILDRICDRPTDLQHFPLLGGTVLGRYPSC